MSSTGKSCELQKKNPRDLLEAQDCVACRIFGSTACLAMAGYTAYWSYRQRAQYKGPIRVIYLASCIGLASGRIISNFRRKMVPTDAHPANGMTNRTEIVW